MKIKKIPFLFISFMIFLFSIAPVFSLAVVVDPTFIVESPLSESFMLSNAEGCQFSAYVAVSSNLAYWNGIYINTSDLEYVNSYTASMYYSSTWNRAGLHVGIRGGNSGSTVRCTYKSINLITGNYSETIRTITLDSSGNGDLNICKLPESFSNELQYCFPLNGSTVSFSNGLLQSPYDYVRYARPAVADHTINSYIPEPHADLSHFYFADSVYLYAIYIDAAALYEYKGTVSNGAYWNQYEFYQFIPSIEKLNSTTVRVKFENNMDDDVNIFVSKYDLISGEFISISQNVVASASVAYQSFTVASDEYMSIWYDGFLNTDGLEGFSRMSIRWSETIDYNSQFIQITNALDSFYTSFTTAMQNQYLAVIGVQDELALIRDDYLVVIRNNLSAFIEWFKNDFWGYDYYNQTDLQFYMRDFMTRFSQFYMQIQFDIIPDLEQIIELLGGETTMPDNSELDSQLSQYEAAEGVVMASGRYAIQDAESYIRNGKQSLQNTSSGFNLIRNIFESFIFTGYNYYFVFFALVIGTVSLIIGRKLR